MFFKRKPLYSVWGKTFQMRAVSQVCGPLSPTVRVLPGHPVRTAGTAPAPNLFVCLPIK